MRRALACLLVLASLAGAAEPERAARFRELHGLEGPRFLAAGARAEVRVHDPAIQVPPAFLEAAAAAARELEATVGPAGDPLRIEVAGPSRSLAVAYNPSEDAVIFPKNPRALNHGLEDHDRLRHELFHHQVGRVFPQLVTSEALASGTTREVHEAAADFFAYLGDENETFGDRFEERPGPLRRYRSRYRYPLVQGSHARGNALTGYWIRKGWGLPELVERLAGGCEEVACMVEPADHAAFGLDPATRPEIRLGVEGHEPSPLNRYRVAPGEVLHLASNAALATELGRLETRFTTRRGGPVPGWSFRALEVTPERRRFELLPETGAKPAKVIVRHLHQGAVVGFDVLYLSVREGP